MSKFFIFFLLFSTTILSAQEAGGKGPRNEEGKGKEHFIKNLKKQEEALSKRLNELRDTISCVEKAQDTAAEAKCREDFKNKRQAHRKELQEKRKDEKSFKAGQKKAQPNN